MFKSRALHVSSQLLGRQVRRIVRAREVQVELGNILRSCLKNERRGICIWQDLPAASLHGGGEEGAKFTLS
jgi:hypothetical protein